MPGFLSSFFYYMRRYYFYSKTFVFYVRLVSLLNNYIYLFFLSLLIIFR